MSWFAYGAAAALPPMLLLWYVHSRDKDPEPRGLLWRTFFWGVALCVPVAPVAFGVQALAVRWGWHMKTWDMALLLAFLGVALPEQCFRLLVLRLYVWNKPAFDEPLDGVVYGATVSLGFAMLENLFYVIALSEAGLGLAMLRAVTSVPQQAFTGIILGAFVGRARFDEDRARGTWRLASGFAATTLLQGAYYTLLFLGSFPLFPLTLLVLLLEVRWGRRLYKELQAEQRSTNPSVTDAPALPQPSTLSARLRWFVGAAGLWCCVIAWGLLLIILFGSPRPWDADTSDKNGFAASLTTVATIICLVVRRSGQRDLA